MFKEYFGSEESLPHMSAQRRGSIGKTDRISREVVAEEVEKSSSQNSSEEERK